MTRYASFSGSFADMPLTIRRAAEVDRDWYSGALCLPLDGHPHALNPWLHDEDPDMVELALLTCAICPVQWECAETAIEAHEKAGVWAARLEDLRLLSKRIGALGEAKASGTPVQVAVRQLRGDIS